METVLRILRKHKLYAKTTKCEFGKIQIEFLGHIVSHNGIAPDPKKLEAIVQWPVPETVRDVRGFMGLSNYYRSSAKGFATVSAPLTRLMSDKIKGKLPWTQEEQVAFNKVKQIMITAPVLAIPDPDKQFTVQVDASQVGLGATLTQKFEGHDRVIAYHSRE